MILFFVFRMLEKIESVGGAEVNFIVFIFIFNYKLYFNCINYFFLKWHSEKKQKLEDKLIHVKKICTKHFFLNHYEKLIILNNNYYDFFRETFPTSNMRRRFIACKTYLSPHNSPLDGAFK